MLKIKNEKKSKKEANIKYKGLDLLRSPVKDILKKLAEDTFNNDNKKNEKKSLRNIRIKLGRGVAGRRPRIGGSRVLAQPIAA